MDSKSFIATLTISLYAARSIMTGSIIGKHNINNAKLYIDNNPTKKEDKYLLYFASAIKSPIYGILWPFYKYFTLSIICPLYSNQKYRRFYRRFYKLNGRLSGVGHLNTLDSLNAL